MWGKLEKYLEAKTGFDSYLIDGVTCVRLTAVMTRFSFLDNIDCYYDDRASYYNLGGTAVPANCLLSLRNDENLDDFKALFLGRFILLGIINSFTASVFYPVFEKKEDYDLWCALVESNINTDFVEVGEPCYFLNYNLFKEYLNDKG